MSILSIETQIDRLRKVTTTDKCYSTELIKKRLINVADILGEIYNYQHELHVKLEKLSIQVTGIDMKVGPNPKSEPVSVYFDEDDRHPYLVVGDDSCLRVKGEYDLQGWRITTHETGSQIIFSLDIIGQVLGLDEEVLIYSDCIKDSPVTMRVVGITPSTKVYGIVQKSTCNGKFYYTLESCAE